MSKKYSIFITVLFCLFLFGFGIALLVLPDREFSEQENRYLTQFKAPTLDSVFGENGQFMADFEKYVNDQFPLRDQLDPAEGLVRAAAGQAGEQQGLLRHRRPDLVCPVQRPVRRGAG